MATLLLAAALWPSAPERHEVAAAVGLSFGETQEILVLSWTGRHRWGGWFRLDDSERNPGGGSAIPEAPQVEVTAASFGIGWRALQRLTLGIGYGEQRTTTTFGRPSPENPAGTEDRRVTEGGVAAMGQWTFPWKDTLGLAVSATGGPGGLGAAVGLTFIID